MQVVALVPAANKGTTPDLYSSTAAEANATVTQSQTVLFGFFGYNGKTSSQYVQVHDHDSDPAVPIDTSVPKISIKVQPESNFFFDAGMFGLWFEDGVYICNSSTQATKTIGTTDCWFNAQYRRVT